MRIAVIVDAENLVTGPGEGEYILVYEDYGGNVKLVSREPNPAMQAEMHRGLYALRRVKEIGADALVVSEIGRLGFNMARSLGISIYIVPEGLNADDAVKMIINGEVQVANAPTHEHGRMYHSHYEG
jgi:predicted Fe-Mo cluster-binding NifX family protein